MAPAFGEADFFACQEHNVPLVCPVDNQGCYTAEVKDFVGEYIKSADKGIARRLKNENNCSIKVQFVTAIRFVGELTLL